MAKEESECSVCLCESISLCVCVCAFFAPGYQDIHPHISKRCVHETTTTTTTTITTRT